MFKLVQFIFKKTLFIFLSISLLAANSARAADEPAKPTEDTPAVPEHLTYQPDYIGSQSKVLLANVYTRMYYFLLKLNPDRARSILQFIASTVQNDISMHNGSTEALIGDQIGNLAVRKKIIQNIDLSTPEIKTAQDLMNVLNLLREAAIYDSSAEIHRAIVEAVRPINSGDEMLTDLEGISKLLIDWKIFKLRLSNSNSDEKIGELREAASVITRLAKGNFFHPSQITPRALLASGTRSLGIDNYDNPHIFMEHLLYVRLLSAQRYVRPQDRKLQVSKLVEIASDNGRFVEERLQALAGLRTVLIADANLKENSRIAAETIDQLFLATERLIGELNLSKGERSFGVQGFQVTENSFLNTDDVMREYAALVMDLNLTYRFGRGSDLAILIWAKSHLFDLPKTKEYILEIAVKLRDEARTSTLISEAWWAKKTSTAATNPNQPGLQCSSLYR